MPDRKIKIALVGAPNSGKTTLFNWLSGGNYKTVNYPGSTVDVLRGKIHPRYNFENEVIDTPGIYSIEPKSPDEFVTFNSLFKSEKPELVIAVVDITQLKRQLPVAMQLKDCGFRVVIALTMTDLIPGKTNSINIKKIESQLQMPVVLIDGQLGGGVLNLIQILSHLKNETFSAPQYFPWNATRLETAIEQSELIYKSTVLKSKEQKISAVDVTKKWDKLLLHPVGGFVVFVLLMSLLFTSIFWLATPLMEAVDQVFTFFAEKTLAFSPNSLWAQMLSDGVITAIAAVAVFIPQIFILFFGIILLEDSGYLARSAVLVDKPFSWLGMGGRSFVPLLSGYACAVPAMMAARTINSKRERFITLFIIPLMTCSARLPVYALLISILFYDKPSWLAGIALALLYLGSLLLGAVAAKILSMMLPPEKNSFFMMELPLYRKPKILNVIRQAISRTRGYVVRAGPAIFIFSFVIWASTTFPNYKIENKSDRLESSYAGKLGKVIEPLFTPMGGDWRVGVSLMSAFAAREVFVSSLAVVFKVTEATDGNTQQEQLLKSLNNATTNDNQKLFTFASIVSLIVFFMIALQCLSTVSIAIREFNDKKVALIQLTVFTLVAYILAVICFQVLK